MLYDTPGDENNVGMDGYVAKPRSVHFAFRNANITLTNLLDSAWVKCRRRINGLVAESEAECFKRIAICDNRRLEESTKCPAKTKRDRKKATATCHDKTARELHKPFGKEDGATICEGDRHDESRRCLAAAKDDKKDGITACDGEQGHELLKQLAKEIDEVEKKWGEFDRSMLRIGRALGVE